MNVKQFAPKILIKGMPLLNESLKFKFLYPLQNDTLSSLSFFIIFNKSIILC